MYVYGDFIWVILAVSLIAAGQKIEAGDQCQCKKFKYWHHREIAFLAVCDMWPKP